MWFTAASAQSIVTPLLHNWLTGVDFDGFLGDITSQLGDLADEIGDTAIEDAVFDPADYGWTEDIDAGELLKSLWDITLYLEMLSAETGLDLGSFSHLEDLEAELENFGYSRLYNASDVEEYLADALDSFPSTSPYYTDLEEIIEALGEISTGSDDAPELEEVLQLLESLISELQTEVENGETDFVDSLSDLQVAYDVLELFAEDPNEIFVKLAEELQVVFEETGFDYNELDIELGSDWLETFITSVKEFFGSDNVEYDVCADGFVEETLEDAYGSDWFSWIKNCKFDFMFSLPPDCDCLDGADLYNNPLKEDVVSTLNCLFSEGDDLTVKQTLLQCNGEEVETGDASHEDPLEMLQELAELLIEESVEIPDLDLGDSLIPDLDFGDLFG